VTRKTTPDTGGARRVRNHSMHEPPPASPAGAGAWLHTFSTEVDQHLAAALHRCSAHGASLDGDAAAALSPFAPLLAQWQQAASALHAGDPERAGGDREDDLEADAVQRYRAALDVYTGVFADLGQRSAAQLVATRARSAEPSTALLRRFLEEGERLYLATVTTPGFATLQAGLINSALALAAKPAPRRDRRPTPDAAATESGSSPMEPDHARRTTAGSEDGLATLRTELDAAARAVRALGPVHIGPTPRQRVARFGRATLYHYRPARRSGLAVLIVYAFVNRPEILDLEPGRTLIGALVARGIHVYLLDWGDQTGGNPGLTLDSCVNGLLDRCVRRVCSERRRRRIHLLGVCQGGTLSLCYAALHPQRIAALTTMVTPVDFQTPGDLLSRWVRPIDVDRLVDRIGDVPGALLNWLFLALKPFSLGALKYLDLAAIARDPERLRSFVRMEAWINDSPDQPAELLREFLKSFYQRNALLSGALRLAGRRVDLHDITAPVLNIYARHDHIVPPPASLALGQHLGSSDYRVHAFHGGHIGIYVSSKAQTSIPKILSEWLSGHGARSPVGTV